MTPEERMTRFGLKNDPNFLSHERRREFEYWNPDEVGLDVPLIPRALIPEGYLQHWDIWQKEYVLIRERRPGKVIQSERINYPNEQKDMSEDNTVEVTTATPNDAPEAVETPTDVATDVATEPETTPEAVETTPEA